MELFSLQGKHAIVAGGLGKFGLPTSVGLARAGADVTIISRRDDADAAAILASQVVPLSYKQCDLTNPTEFEAFLSEYSSSNRSPDIFVNAISFRSLKNIGATKVQDWQEIITVNARSLYITTIGIADLMARNGGGSIINYSSVYGLVGVNNDIYRGTDMCTEPDYPFLKAGVIGFTRFLATQYGDRQVRLNCVAPGGLEGEQPQSFKTEYAKRVPLGRMMQNDEIAGPIVFLASDASRYVTGTVLTVDGGMTAW